MDTPRRLTEKFWPQKHTRIHDLNPHGRFSGLCFEFVQLVALKAGSGGPGVTWGLQGTSREQRKSYNTGSREMLSRA